MFTGLIEEIGTLAGVRPIGRSATGSSGRDLTVRAPRLAAQAAIGDSIAVNGVCLTVVTLSGDSFTCHAGAETLERTTAGEWPTGQPLNLEPALAVGDRLGGHFVQGHVDCVGSCTNRRQVGETVTFEFTLPAESASYLAEKGSVAIDGISLTVTEVGESRFTVAIIPHTLDHTTLGDFAPGRRVNVEVDILAKYVRRAMGLSSSSGVSEDFLRQHGFM